MFKTKPESNFYNLFAESADLTNKASNLLYDLMINYTNVAEKIAAIEESEHVGDKQVHVILEQLNRTFITPIDREDIYLIAKEMDNIADSIEATAHRFNMFNVQSVTEDAKKLAKMITDCTKALQNVMVELKNMNKSNKLSELVVEVNRIEDEGDRVFRTAITNLFTKETNPIDVVKWNEIYGFLENTLDACEDVANIIEGVVMKHT